MKDEPGGTDLAETRAAYIVHLASAATVTRREKAFMPASIGGH